MKHVNGNGTYSHDFEFRNSLRPGLFVIITANGHNGSQSSQTVQDFRAADVTGMENQTDVTEHLQDFGMQESVSIGNNTNNLFLIAGHQVDIFLSRVAQL